MAGAVADTDTSPACHECEETGNVFLRDMIVGRDLDRPAAWFQIELGERLLEAIQRIKDNTYFGVREVSRELISAVRIMGANHFQVAWRVIIPSALVWVAAGLKISVPYSLVGVVVAEMLASDQGMGFLLARGASQFSAAQTFAAISGLLVVALIVDWLITRVTNYALRWKTAGQQN